MYETGSKIALNSTCSKGVKGQMQRNFDNSFVENPFHKHTNRKQNQLSKFVFAQTVVLKIRKSDDFREFYQNEPKIAAPRLETNFRYL